MNKLAAHRELVLLLVLLVLAAMLPHSPHARPRTREIAWFYASQSDLVRLPPIEGLSATLERIDDGSKEPFLTVRFDYAGQGPVWIPLWKVDLESFQTNARCFVWIRTDGVSDNVAPGIELRLDSGEARRFPGVSDRRPSPDDSTVFYIDSAGMFTRPETPDSLVMGFYMEGPGTFWVKSGRLTWDDRRVATWLPGVLVCLLVATGLCAFATRHRSASDTCGTLTRALCSVLRATNLMFIFIGVIVPPFWPGFPRFLCIVAGALGLIMLHPLRVGVEGSHMPAVSQSEILGGESNRQDDDSSP